MKTIVRTFVLAPGLAVVALPAFAQSSRDYFVELRAAGGVHPFAQLVCFPDTGQGQDTTFEVVAFSRDIARTLRARKQTVPPEIAKAEREPVDEGLLMAWTFRGGVPLHKDPEALLAIPGSHGAMWTADFTPAGSKHKLALRMVFAMSGRYSRDVLVDGRITTSVLGRCEPVDAVIRSGAKP